MAAQEGRRKRVGGKRASGALDRGLFGIERYASDWKAVAFIIFLGLVLLITPQLARIKDGNTNLIGDRPYYDIRIAEHIASSGISDKDDMIEGGRAYMPDPYHLLLSFLGRIAPLEILASVIPLFFGLMSLLLLSLIMEKLSVDPTLKVLMLTVTILSPIFIYTFSISSKYTLIIPLLMSGFYFFLKETRKSTVISLMFFLPIPFFGAFEPLMAIAALFICTRIIKDKNTRFLIVSAVLLILSAAFALYTQSFMPHTHEPSFIKGTIVQKTISDFGSSVGIGIFNLLLALAGLIAVWKRRREGAWLLVMMLVLLLAVVALDYSYIVYAGLMLAYFAALGFYGIMGRRWEVETLRYLTAITLISGLLFSTVSYITIASRSEPNMDQTESMRWMKSIPEGTVLTHYSNGFWIERIAGKRVLMDNYMAHDPSINARYETSQKIFMSRNLKTTKELLESNNIKYVWIDGEMKGGEVWTREDDGLLFLLRNNETFKKIYSTSDVEIYEVLGS